jgi:Trk-type K+ transport system membrane component
MLTAWTFVAALLPTIGVAFLFYVIIKAMMEGDRRERLAHSQWEAQQRDSAPDSPKAPGPSA